MTAQRFRRRIQLRNRRPMPHIEQTIDLRQVHVHPLRQVRFVHAAALHACVELRLHIDQRRQRNGLAGRRGRGWNGPLVANIGVDDGFQRIDGAREGLFAIGAERGGFREVGKCHENGVVVVGRQCHGIPDHGDLSFRACLFQPEILLDFVDESAYLTGWRKSEILSLTWKNIDFTAGEVRLEPGTTKNKKGRTFPFTTALRHLLESQRGKRDALRKAFRTPCDRVFFRMVAQGRQGVKHPKAITSFSKAFKTACPKARCPARTPHDLRRTAVRDFVRENIPQTVVMKLTGHLTDSVFRRYDIVSPNDLKVAAERLARRG
jgi:integrase-like protein